MKQNITKEQIDELSYEAKEKLYLALWSDMMEDENRKTVGSKKVVDINPAYLTIGRMIEFLENSGGFRWSWDTDGAWIGNEIVIHWGDKKEKELCDVLWEEVKAVLNNLL